MSLGLKWADYIAGHPERLPRPVSGAVASTWADLKPGEQRRVTRNWRRWRKRRLERLARPIDYRQVGDRIEDVRFRGLRG